ncbi:hypothetical protein H5410_014411 [Solanum commersonii]|uniref:Uncharacterized protein n=1 Tax=Solanum commersonii TaxID=4109 RepID=A0A9J5ZR60_SOLCO|nr:hypothetical protein H5410_014411 [Solanum commersonii]
MAPKAKNMAGSTRSRKGEASGSSSGQEPTVNELGLRFIFENLGDCNLTLVRQFYANWLTEIKYKTMHVRGKNVKFSARILNKLLGTPNCDHEEFNNLKDKPPYKYI